MERRDESFQGTDHRYSEDLIMWKSRFKLYFGLCFVMLVADFVLFLLYYGTVPYPEQQQLPPTVLRNVKWAAITSFICTILFIVWIVIDWKILYKRTNHARRLVSSIELQEISIDLINSRTDLIDNKDQKPTQQQQQETNPTNK